jgi:hypothetical protein
MAWSTHERWKRREHPGVAGYLHRVGTARTAIEEDPAFIQPHRWVSQIQLDIQAGLQYSLASNILRSVRCSI